MCQGGAVIFLRRRVAPKINPYIAKIDQRINAAGGEAQRLLQAGLGLSQAVLPPTQMAQIVVRFWQSRVERHGFAIGCLRGFKRAPIGQDIAQIVRRFGKFGIKPARLEQGCLCLIEAVLFAQRGAEAAMGVGQSGVQADGLTKMPLGLNRGV